MLSWFSWNFSTVFVSVDYIFTGFLGIKPHVTENGTIHRRGDLSLLMHLHTSQLSIVSLSLRIKVMEGLDGTIVFEG